ncbi:hypothetical protein ACLBXM_14210 [Xanthobacteraceae bacterium A53D]
MASRQEIDSVIEAVIRERLTSAEVVRVLVEHDEEINGSLYIRARVIVKPKRGRLDPGETSQMIRHVRTRLIEMGEETFPLINYIDQSEAGDLAAA